MEVCKEFIDESNTMEKKDLEEKRVLNLRWLEGAGVVLHAGVHRGPVGHIAEWKREKKRQELIEEGEKSYRIPDI